MKKIFLLATLFFWGTAWLASAQEIPPRPSPARLVNDFTATLNSNEVGQLEAKLRGYMDSTSTQMVVVVMNDVEIPADYAYQLGRAWGIGQKGKNNGLVLLWSPNRRKVFIAPGYGLEGAIPDGIAKRIITNEITPAFRAGQWYEGLDAATTALFKRANGEYQKEASSEDDGGGAFMFLLILILFFFVIVWLMKKGGGGNNQGGNYRRDVFWPHTTVSSWGTSSGNWGGGGSSWGGGGGGGFDFGGGSFGGGGAGGDY